MQKLVNTIINELYAANKEMRFVFPVDEVVKIVERVAEEYNDGWILCSKEMPPERQSMFAKFRGTEKWASNMFMTISDDVQVTLLYSNGSTAVTTMHTADGEWSKPLSMLRNYRVISWKPISKPMKLKQEYLDELP